MSDRKVRSRALDLWGTLVTVLGPLKGLTALQALGLHGTQVTDLGPLHGLIALQTLDLAKSKVERLEPVQHLPSLHEITGTTKAEIERVDAYRKQNGLPAVQFRDAL
jgi:hypothetical protein